MTEEYGVYHGEKATWGKVPERLMHDITITDGAVRLYAHMQWRYGSNKQNFEGQKSMGETLDVSEKTIADRIDELASHDWVVVIHRHGQQHQTNVYHIFETQKLCQEWRTERQIAAPENITLRKSRKGVGGKKANPNSSSVSHAGANPNSSSDNLDSINHTDSSTPNGVPTTTRKRDLIFDAFASMLQATTPELVQAKCSKIGLYKKSWMKILSAIDESRASGFVKWIDAPGQTNGFAHKLLSVASLEAYMGDWLAEITAKEKKAEAAKFTPKVQVAIDYSHDEEREQQAAAYNALTLPDDDYAKDIPF